VAQYGFRERGRLYSCLFATRENASNISRKLSFYVIAPQCCFNTLKVHALSFETRLPNKEAALWLSK
jgi:hypothetical protein